MEKSLVINYKRQDSILKIFPCGPIISSNSGSNIHFEYYQIEPHETPEYIPTHNAVAISHKSIRVSRSLGGKCKKERFDNGKILVTPAKVSHFSRWEEETFFSLMYFKPGFVSNVAYELINPDTVELLPYFAQNDPLVYGIGQTLKSLLQSRQSIDQIYADELAVCLATHLLYNYCSVKHRPKDNTHALSSVDLRQAIDYINSHIGEKLGLTELSNLLGMSESYFGRLFKKSTGVSPAQYIIKCRLEKAAGLLKNMDLTLEDIAQQTGFSHQSHFSSAFKGHFSVSPSQYRKMI